MKIIRNGIEIELTPEEVRMAYDEQENIYRINDILERYNVPESDWNFISERFYKRLSDNDGYWDRYWETLESVCNEYGYEERERY